ncbi:flocculation protein FLO11-like isoform X1 [Thunnus maccoyii]|uniref:flocculation protein FLO11-like isoform X1 n=2 Tax=Thunnus maccoyii TaxID=8240 RepID=UPI001C4CAA0E|nr:flocculation protein FLO11-like isoform X1 [Thunnus maccoyii]
MVNRTTMSADDFQTKYASVMESMLRSAVAETTKLFETMVDELKAEISMIKKENEDLKTRCSQFENAKSQPTVHTGEREPPPGPIDGSEKRDTAVQCDLVPFCTMLVEQCQPLRHSSWQNQEQQCGYEEMEQCLQKDQDYEERNSLMPLVKKEEEIEPTVVCRQGLSDNADPPQASACGTETEGLLINQECSNGEMTLHQKDEETRVAMEPPCSVMDSNLQAQKQLSEPGHSQVISIAAVKYVMEEESGVGLKISEIRTQGKLVTSAEQPLVAAQKLSEVEPHEERQLPANEMSNKQMNVTVQQFTKEQLAETIPLNKEVVHEELKGSSTGREASSKPGLSVCRRRGRGRPPKKAKHLQQPVKEIHQTLFTDVPTDQEVLKAPPTEVSSANETLKTPSAEPVQAPSVQHREHCTSVTLQDAMLLVEAMNQSTVKNTFSSPQGMAPPQIQCAPRVVTLQTVDEVPADLLTPGSPPQTPPLPVVTQEVAVDIHVTEMSTTTQTTKETPCDASQTTDAIESNKTQSHIKVVKPQQPHAGTPSNTTTSPPSSTAATQTSVSLKQHPLHPLITLAMPSKSLSNTVPNKIIVVPRSSSLMSHTIAALSPTQLSTVVSKVANAQNNNSLPASTAAGLPLGTPPLSSVSQKTIYVTSRKSHPVVTSQTSTSSTHQQSGTLPYPKVTIIIPRQVSAVASKKQKSQKTLVLTTKQESAEPVAAVKVSRPLLVSSSQQISISQMASEQQSTTSSVGVVPITVSPEAPLTTEQKLSAVVKLSRLPFPMSTKESVLISRLLSDGSSEGTTQEKPSSVVKSTQPSKKTISLSEVPALSTDICPNLKKTSVTVSVCASQVSEEPNDIQEKASLSSETCISLDAAPVNSCVQPSTPSKVSAPVLEKSAIAVSTTESSAVSGTAIEPTYSLDEEIISNSVQDCVQPNEPPIQEKESAKFVQLSSITSKDIADPHLQMTKTQFLAQLAVSPVVQAPKKASTNDFADARASCSETSADDKRKLQKNSLVARLRSHLKTHLQARRTETNTELLKETETTPVSPEKPRLENVSQKETNTPSEPVSLNKLHVDDVTSLKNIPNDPTSISPGRSGLCKDGVRSKRTFSEPTSVSCRSKLSKNNPDPKRATSKSTPVSHRRSSFARDVVDPENTKSISVSPRSSSSTIEGVSTKKTKTSSETPRRCTAKDNASPKKTQSTSLSPRRTSSTRDGTAPKNTKSTSVSPKHCSSVRDSASPKKTKSTPASPRRSRSAREHASPKKTKSISARPRKSSLIKNGSSPEMSSSELTPVSLRRYTSTKDGSSAKQIKRESYSFSPRRYSNTTDGGEIGTPSARQPKLTKYGARHQRTGESTPAKRPRLIQDVTIPKKTLRLVNAKKLSKAAKAKTLAKMKNSNQSTLQNGAKTSHIAKNGANCEVVKRFTSKAVWIPPIMPVSKTASLGGKRSSLLPIKKETSSPRSKNHTVIYPTVRGPPIVSPLQPLLVIGRCLLKNQCGECGRVLSSSAALESHVSCHTGHRPFSCTLCGKSFPDSKGFKRHGRVHRNGRIHICQQCGKGFVYRFGLTKHLQMVHGRIKPFVCQICGKAFFAKRDVETHIRIHTGEKPFPCNLCEKRFARRVELNVHLRWHNGEKRHWCPYCGKGFLDSNNLKRHKYTHTGEKPHSCPHCPKNFTQSGHLKKHVKNVHKIQ